MRHGPSIAATLICDRFDSACLASSALPVRPSRRRIRHVWSLESRLTASRRVLSGPVKRLHLSCTHLLVSAIDARPQVTLSLHRNPRLDVLYPHRSLRFAFAHQEVTID